MLRAGTQTAQPSAPPSRTPASDSASTRNDSSAAETTSQVKSAEKKTPAPAGAAPTTKGGAQSVGSGASGPDVLGLRIGTTPAEARAIFKSRILLSDRLQKQYVEESATLGFNVPAQGVSGPVPNGTYLNKLQLNGSPDDEHKLYVFFAPVPGHEGIVSLYRIIDFPAGKKPTFNAFEKTLVEKYGTPTYSTSSIFYWSYDSNGTLQKPLKDSTNASWCYGLARGAAQTEIIYWNHPDFKLQERSVRCGAIVVSILFGPMGGGETLVDHHETSLVGYDAAIRALKEAGTIVDKAGAAASEAAIKKGQQQKPDF